MEFYFQQTNSLQPEQPSADHHQSIANPQDIDPETIVLFCE
jgi:hypothetical protein